MAIIVLVLFLAIIEFVRDACTVRAFVLPTFHHITVMMSGIKVHLRHL